jgi:TolB-like protein
MSGDSPIAGDAQSSVPLEAACPPLSKAVFVSYASQDVAVANAVVEALESQGIRCWIAPRDVVPGSLYADEIVGAINDAKVVVLVLSEHSIASPHVGKEIERASSKRRRIIAFHIDAAPLTRGYEYFLSESQWIDVGAGAVEAAAAKLVEAVRRHLDPSAAARGPSEQLIVRPTRTGPRARWMVAGGVAVLSVALAYFVIEKPWLPRYIAEEQPAAQPVAVAFTPPPHSIAVLPFVNMSGDASQEYFSDGISEELLNSLSRLNELQVAARTSSFSFKGQNVDVSTIAHKLNVGAILEGSVRRAGNTVRITAQLINGVSGFHIWSQTYDRNLTDILKVQTEVATSVAQQLEVKLVGDDVAKLELGGTENAQAYDAYLRGKQISSKGDTQEADARAALAAFDQAIALDPNYALAQCGRSNALGNIATFNAKPGDRAALRERAREAAERAVVLAPQLGEPHLTLAETLAFSLLDYTDAAPEFERALALAPGSARVQIGFAGFSVQLGHFERALAAARRGVSLDPQNVWAHISLGQVLYLSRHYGEALVALQHAKALDPGSHFIASITRTVLLVSGQVEQVRQQCESPATPLKEDSRHACLARAYHFLGRQADAERELEKWKALAGDGDAFDYAELYAQWGNAATALQWLTKAERLRDPAFQGLRVDPQLDPIRNEPQFKAIETRMNFPP